MGGSRLQAKTARSSKEHNQREFFGDLRRRLRETEESSLPLQDELNRCRTANGLTHMANIIPSKDLMALASPIPFSPPLSHSTSELLNTASSSRQNTSMVSAPHPKRGRRGPLARTATPSEEVLASTSLLAHLSTDPTPLAQPSDYSTNTSPTEQRSWPVPRSRELWQPIPVRTSSPITLPFDRPDNPMSVILSPLEGHSPSIESH